MDIPVAFIIFNRPDVTARVFEAVRAARPKELLVIADGPRANRPGEAERCAAARAVIDAVDWPCRVGRNFSDVNLGCGPRVSSGLSWVFETVERAIVLEDDCLPLPQFFEFCGTMLDRYATDDSVMHIAGTNLQPKESWVNGHYLSRIPWIWGWASWRRAWKKYDFRMSGLGSYMRSGEFRERCADADEIFYWKYIWKAVASGKINTWDYQWMYSIFRNKAFAATAGKNLVANIGFGPGSTHTLDENHPSANLPTESMTTYSNRIDGPLARQFDLHVVHDVMHASHIRKSQTFWKRVGRRLRSFISAKGKHER